MTNNPDERKKLMWFAALAVLKCPMPVEDKIKTLEAELFPLLDEGLPFIPPTGLEPFDRAISNYFNEVTDANKRIS